jgi:hypothetical protein
MEVLPQHVKDPAHIFFFDATSVPTLVYKRSCKIAQYNFAGDAVSLPASRGCILKVGVKVVKFLLEKVSGMVL